jgi:hypothetical protein
VERKKTLVRIVWAFALCGLTVASVPFFSAWIPDGASELPQKFLIDTSVLAPGRPHIIELSPSRPLIVFRATRAQLDDLAMLDPHVWNRATGSALDGDGTFVYWGLSTGNYGGCRLIHFPPGESRLSGIETGARWFGGYWAAGCEASYDYAGRAIKTKRYSYSGNVARARSLRSPAIELIGEEQIAVIVDRLR